MVLNPQFIEKLASEVYWSFVFDYGIQATGFPEYIEDIPNEMWSLELAVEKLSYSENIPDEEFSIDFIDSVYHAVAETIVDHVRREENIIGIIFQEDFKSCKEPDFRFLDMLNHQFSDSDQNAGYKTNLKGNYKVKGDLLLRTPFPSGVLLKSIPNSTQILIPDTSKALGFQKTLVLVANRGSFLPSNEYGYKYFVTGVFHIPTTNEHNAQWLKLIPNAIAALQCFTLLSKNGGSCTGEIISKSNVKKKSFLKKLTSLFQ